MKTYCPVFADEFLSIFLSVIIREIRGQKNLC